LAAGSDACGSASRIEPISGSPIIGAWPLARAAFPGSTPGALAPQQILQSAMQAQHFRRSITYPPSLQDD
jgi:hypothetical protein